MIPRHRDQPVHPRRRAAGHLGLPRTEGDAAPGDPRAPAPTIKHLGLLLDSFTEAGLQLTVAVRGEPGSLSGPADLAFYRIVQEALKAPVTG